MILVFHMTLMEGASSVQLVDRQVWSVPLYVWLAPSLGRMEGWSSGEWQAGEPTCSLSSREPQHGQTFYVVAHGSKSKSVSNQGRFYRVFCDLHIEVTQCHYCHIQLVTSVVDLSRF